MITSDYIDSKMNTIINADCLEVMEKIPDNYFDLVLTFKYKQCIINKSK